MNAGDATRALALAARLLDPDGLGYAVTGEVRDAARAVFGKPAVESKPGPRRPRLTVVLEPGENTGDNAIASNDSEMLDFLDQQATVNFSYETVCLTFEVQEEFEGANSARDIIAAAMQARNLNG